VATDHQHQIDQLDKRLDKAEASQVHEDRELARIEARVSANESYVTELVWESRAIGSAMVALLAGLATNLAKKRMGAGR